MIECFRAIAAWFRNGLDIEPGELGDMFAAFQIISGVGGFVIVIVLWAVS